MAETYSSRYADPSAIANRQLDLVARWGRPVQAGMSVLELGCADGFSTASLARAGYRVTAVDKSPAMLEDASRRLSAEHVNASLEAADVSTYVPSDEYDVVIGLMWTWFRYVHDPVAVLSRLAERTRVKALVDVNPREVSIRDAVRCVRAAGFESVAWRPFFVPQSYRLPRPAAPALRLAERTPLLRGALLRRKFVVVVKGEHPQRDEITIENAPRTIGWLGGEDSNPQ